MPKYTRTITVTASRIVSSEERRDGDDRLTSLVLQTDDGSEREIALEHIVQTPPDALKDGYLVDYEDSHVSIWRAADFEEAFEPVES